MTRAELIDKFASTVGIEKAHEVIDDAAAKTGLSGASFDRDSTLKLLEHLAQLGGLVGTVARFLKVRVILQPAAK